MLICAVTQARLSIKLAQHVCHLPPPLVIFIICAYLPPPFRSKVCKNY